MMMTTIYETSDVAVGNTTHDFGANVSYMPCVGTKTEVSLPEYRYLSPNICDATSQCGYIIDNKFSRLL